MTFLTPSKCPHIGIILQGPNRPISVWIDSEVVFQNSTSECPMVRASMIIIFLGSFIGNLVDRKMDSIKLNDHFANTKKIIFCILFNNWTEFIILSLLTAAAVLTVHDTGDLAKRIMNEISYFSNGFFIVRCQIFQSRSLKSHRKRFTGNITHPLVADDLLRFE